MNDLTDKKCVPCEGGVVPFDISEIHKYQKKVDGWEVVKGEKNIYFLEKKFTFKNFSRKSKFCKPSWRNIRKGRTSSRNSLWMGLC